MFFFPSLHRFLVGRDDLRIKVKYLTIYIILQIYIIILIEYGMLLKRHTGSRRKDPLI